MSLFFDSNIIVLKGDLILCMVMDILDMDVDAVVLVVVGFGLL